MTKVNHIAISRSGDICGMSNDGKGETLSITTKEELKAWREFNRLNKLHHRACSEFLKDTKNANAQKLFDAAYILFIDASHKLKDLVGSEVWSKYHTRTTWVVKKAAA